MPDIPLVDISQPTMKVDKDLWFPDGNVVLVTGNSVFKVHRSILAVNSPIFEDLFTLPTPEPGLDSEYQALAKEYGCPVVRLPDGGDDLAHFLKALYYRDYFRVGNVTSFSTLSSLLRLSTKYIVKHLRFDVIQHLKSDFPSTLSSFRPNGPIITCFPIFQGASFTVAALARDCQAWELLPAALYRCTQSSIESILDGTSSPSSKRAASKTTSDPLLFFSPPPRTILSEEERKQVILTREALLNLKRGMLSSALLPRRTASRSDTDENVRSLSEDCTSVMQCTQVLATLHSHILRSTALSRPDVLNEPESFLEPSFWSCTQGLCTECSKMFKSELEAGRQEVWTNLPRFFDLSSDWDSLIGEL